MSKIEKINETTWIRIQKLLQRSYDDGLGFQEVARQLRAKYQQFSAGQAVTIARTESTRILNGSANVAWKGAGVTHKQWLATRDSETRDSHLGVDGEVVKMGQPFSNGLMHPGGDGPPEEVCNCRCTEMPIIHDDPNANLSRNYIKSRTENIDDDVIDWSLIYKGSES